MVRASVREDLDSCPRKATSIYEAGVVERIAEDHVARAYYCLNGAEVRGVAGREEGGGRCPEKVGKGCLGFSVSVHRTGDQTGGGGAKPVDAKRGLHRGRYRRMIG